MGFMQNLRVVKILANPLQQPPIALLNIVCSWQAQIKAENNPQSDLVNTPDMAYLELTALLKLYLKSLALKELAGNFLAPSYLCSACGDVGVHHGNLSIALT